LQANFGGAQGLRVVLNVHYFIVQLFLIIQITNLISHRAQVFAHIQDDSSGDLLSHYGFFLH
jgi:hypothetical protein